MKKTNIFLMRITAVFALACFMLSSSGVSYAIRQEQPGNTSVGMAAGNSLSGKANSAGMEAVRGFRAYMDRSLPSNMLPAGRVMGVIDLISGQTDGVPEYVAKLSPDVRNEYQNMLSYLKSQYPDLEEVVSIDVLPALNNDSVVVGFEITTKSNRYILAVQKDDAQSLDYPGLRTRLGGLEGQNYRLEEIITGVSFPLQPPYYSASFLRGETDRFGAELGNGMTGAWEIKPKPGRSRGDFQLFRLVSEEPPSALEDLLAEPQPGQPGNESHFQRDAGRQQHNFVRDTAIGVASDVVVGPARSGRGSLLVVAFPNGNSGFGFFDRSPENPCTVSGIEVVTRGSQGQKGVRFSVTSSSPQASFGANDVVLDTVRHIREWATTERDEYSSRGRAKTFVDFSDAIQNLPHEVTIGLRRAGVNLGEMAFSSWPHKYHTTDGQGHHIYFVRRSIDGHLYLVEMIFPLSCEVQWASEKGDVSVSSGSRGEPLRFEVVVTTDFEALSLLNAEDIFTNEALELARQSGAFRHRLEEVTFLASRQFFSAGSYRFLQYFSRDTLIWLNNCSRFLRPGANEIVLQGIIDRILENGELPSVEELGGEVTYELMEEFCLACREARISGDYRRVRAVAFTLRNVPAHRLKYGVPDGNVMFLPVVVDYLRRSDVTREEKAAFLAHCGPQGESNLRVILRNIDFVAKQAGLYAGAGRSHSLLAAGLIGSNNPDPTAIKNWRDVVYGLGGGTIPSDVNAGWMPLALQAGLEILQQFGNMQMSDNDRELFETIMREQGGIAGFRGLLTVWEGVRSHVSMVLTPDEIRSRLLEYLGNAQLSAEEQAWFLDRPLGAGVTLKDFLRSNAEPAMLRGGAKFFPVALSGAQDGTAMAVPLIASDGIVSLFDNDISPRELLDTLTIMLPYPVGLWTPAGLLTASPTLSNNRQLWSQITKGAYGGCVIYGWQMEFFTQGLVRQIRRFENVPQEAVDRDLLEVLYSVLEACYRADTPSAASHELWTWDIDRTGFHSISFGSLPAHNDESNPVQLWSTSFSEVDMRAVREGAQRMGLRCLKDGDLLDALARVKERYPELPVADMAAMPSLPRIAVLNHSIIGGGGVNAVALEHLEMFTHAGYPVTCIAGRCLNTEQAEDVFAGLRRLNPGFNFVGLPALDVKPEIERDVRSGNLDPESFENEVSTLMIKLDEALRGVDIVIIHQAMSLATNLAATVALERLAAKYRGQKRFIAWIHNIDFSARDLG